MQFMPILFVFFIIIIIDFVNLATLVCTLERNYTPQRHLTPTPHRLQPHPYKMSPTAFFLKRKKENKKFLESKKKIRLWWEAADN